MSPRSVQGSALLLTASVLSLVASCGGASRSTDSAATTTPTPAEAPTPRAELEQIHRRACACRDTRCADVELRHLAAFVDKHRSADVGRVEGRALAKVGLSTGECLVRSGVPKYQVGDALGRGRPLELLTHIVGGMCACPRSDRACGTRHLGRFERFVAGNANAVTVKQAGDKHAVLTRRFNQCALRTSILEAKLVAVLAKHGTQAPAPPSAVIADKLDGIATDTCKCTDRACADTQLLALVAHVQQHAPTRPVRSTISRIRAAAKRTTDCLIKAGVPTDDIIAALKRAVSS